MNQKSSSPVVSIAKLQRKPFQQGEAYESADANLSGPLGFTRIGAVYTEVPPGKSACPFHVHHVEDEMFVILGGSGEYRFGDETYQVAAGDVLGAPRGGAEFAHQLINTGTKTLKYLAISSKSEIEVCEYPDSGKFMVRSGSFRFIGRQDDERDYWEGEDGA